MFSANRLRQSSFCVLLVMIMSPSLAFTNDFYISPIGSDSYPGSLEKPFASIQKAISLAKPGTTIYLREGRYYQKIDLAGVSGKEGSPIILTAYQNEKVTLDGTKPIKTTWKLDKGYVYKTKVKEDVIQLFIDNTLMTLARFPNAVAFSDKVWNSNQSRREKMLTSRKGTVVDNPQKGAGPKLAEAKVNFTDCVAILNFGDHVTGSRIVKKHRPGSDTFSYSPNVTPYKNTHNYFLEGGLGAAERVMLDSPGEWAYDEKNKILFLWSPDNKSPQGKSIYGKSNQPYIMTGDARTKHIIIDGIDFFAGTFLFQSSDDITIKNSHSDYYTSSTRSLGQTKSTPTASFIGNKDDLCKNILITNCIFSHADSGGFIGNCLEDSSFINNLFYKIDYACVSKQTLSLSGTRDLLFKRNTIDTAGSGLGVTLGVYDSTEGRPWIFEYNFITRCGLLEGDGSALYSPHEQIVESVSRFNWFISNRERDFRWDGWNDPLLGVKANFYRNVAMADRIKTIAVGDGCHLKGDFHEIYHNIGIYKWSSIEVSVAKGGNKNSITKNNAADALLDNPLPGKNSNNHRGGMCYLLRDPDNWDFRPRDYAAPLIDKGAIIKNCIVNGKGIDITKDFIGQAPDIGAYEHGDTHYWIPGRKEDSAAMPVPRNKGKYVQLTTDLMYLPGLNAEGSNIYFGKSLDSLKLLTSQKVPHNIVKLSDFTKIEGNTTYFWRVDTLNSSGSVLAKGKIWSFKTKVKRSHLPWKSIGKSKAHWEYRKGSGDIIFDAVGKSPGRSALLYSKQTYKSEKGLILKVGFKTDEIYDKRGQLSFGLIREGQPITKVIHNPFKVAKNIYSLGINVVGTQGSPLQGLNFINPKSTKQKVSSLDQSGTHVQFSKSSRFQTNESCIVELEILSGGHWKYCINGIEEAKGTIPNGFDLSKSYYVGVFAQDFKEPKSIQHISIIEKD